MLTIYDIQKFVPNILFPLKKSKDEFQTLVTLKVFLE